MTLNIVLMVMNVVKTENTETNLYLKAVFYKMF